MENKIMEKKKKRDKCYPFSLDGFTITESIFFLKEKGDKYGFDSIIEMPEEIQTEFGDIVDAENNIWTYRDETDEEYNNRIKRENQRILQNNIQKKFYELRDLKSFKGKLLIYPRAYQHFMSLVYTNDVLEIKEVITVTEDLINNLQPIIDKYYAIENYT